MKMKDCTIDYLVASAESETLALGRKLDGIAMSRDDRLIVNAYLGSIGARLINAEMKLRERAIAAEDAQRAA